MLVERSELLAMMVKQEPDFEGKKGEVNDCSSLWLGASF